VAEVPATGEVRVPVLLVQYSDVKLSSENPKTAFEGHINGEDYKDEGGYGSVREYFVDQSEGKFMPQFDIIGPITLSNPMEYYGGNDAQGNDKNAREMVQEACQNADVDFSQYDNNGDGYVDIVYIIYAGYGEASNVAQLENTIWPHQWQLETALSLDGVKISKYACNNELDGYQGNELDGIGTFCHEFSHCLGLPDFYPTGDDQTPFGMERGV
jgi:M6 family metalloprotease-like protein